MDVCDHVGARKKRGPTLIITAYMGIYISHTGIHTYTCSDNLRHLLRPIHLPTVPANWHQRVLCGRKLSDRRWATCEIRAVCILTCICVRSCGDAPSRRRGRRSATREVRAVCIFTCIMCGDASSRRGQRARAYSHASVCARVAMRLHAAVNSLVDGQLRAECAHVHIHMHMCAHMNSVVACTMRIYSYMCSHTMGHLCMLYVHIRTVCVCACMYICVYIYAYT